MIKKVYLLWTSYINNEVLLIGTLTELENKGYTFNFSTEAKKAVELGCFLPFRYTEETLVFDSLPFFFEQRILKGKFNKETFGINYDINNKLGVLVYGDAVKNNDNFRVISEEKYKGLKKS